MSPAISPVAPSPTLPLSSRRPSVSFGGFGLNGAHRSLLDSLEPTGEEKSGAEGMGIRAKRGAGKPVRHSLHRTPTQAQRARWEAVQKAKRQGLSLRAIARKLGMSRVTTTKYALAESPPTKRFSAKERAKAEALAASMVAAD